jgi:hypothetical protein
MIEDVVSFDTATPVVLATKGSVGQNGNNFFEDTKLIQSMLNNVPPGKSALRP